MATLGDRKLTMLLRDAAGRAEAQIGSGRPRPLSTSTPPSWAAGKALRAAAAGVARAIASPGVATPGTKAQAGGAAASSSGVAPGER